MSVYLRSILLAASVLTCIYITRKIRKSQVQVMDMFFWVAMSALFIIMSVFPSVAIWFASAFRFESPVNFVFLMIIFLLLFRCFLMSIRLSQLESKVKSLIEELAVRDMGNKGKEADNKAECQGGELE